jgi:hypothetical protein
MTAPTANKAIRKVKAVTSPCTVAARGLTRGNLGA